MVATSFLVINKHVLHKIPIFLILQTSILMPLLYHNDTIIKKEKELLRALLSQFCKLEFHKRICFLNANIPSLPSPTKSSGVSGIGCFSLKNSVI